MRRALVTLAVLALSACSGGGDGSTTVTSGLAPSEAVQLPPVESGVVERSLQVLEENEIGLAAAEQAGGTLLAEGDEAQRCADALEALAPVSPDELLEAAAAVPDEVLASALLGERAALIRLARACGAGAGLPNDQLQRLAAVRELINRRVAELEAAG